MSPVFDFHIVLPILIVCAYALLVLVLSPTLRGSGGTAAAISGLGLVVAGYACVQLYGTHGSTAYGMVRVDDFATFFDLVFLLAAFLTVLVSSRSLERQGANHAEYYALLLFSVAGMMTMAGSQNLLVILIGLELLSIPLYVLAGVTRLREASVEASLKYFLLGAFSTGFIVYGLAFVYGATGTLFLPRLLLSGEAGPTLALGAGLVIIGLAFKIAAVPFHFWAPDVYQGAPTVVTAFMAAGTKAAAFAALLRVLGVGFNSPELAVAWGGLMTILAILTMTVANLIALAQTNVKRLLAYSSIAHAGYLIIAVVTMGKAILHPTGEESGPGDDAVQAIGFYLVSYALMTIGAFAVASLIGREGSGGDEGYGLRSYAGLGRRMPVLATAMTVFMLSLAGLPPTAGFVAKFYLFKGAINGGLYFLAIAGALNAVVGAGYYLKIVVAMWMREPAVTGAGTADAPPAEAAMSMGASTGAALAIAAAGTLILGIYPGPLLAVAHHLYGALR